MNRTPLISIITPTFNQGKFITHCIKSVINQTYNNWEMIIINDGATDETAQILDYYSKFDKRIRCYNHKKNWGIKKLGDSYNQALRYSKGQIVAILESDDFWPSHKLERQVKAFDNKKVVLSYGDCIMTDEQGYLINLFTYSGKKSWLNNNPPGSILYLFSELKLYLIPVTVMVRKKNLEKIGGFKKDKFFFSGIDFPSWLYLSLEGKFHYQKEIYGYYRKQSNSNWFRLAKKTPTMGREEFQKCFTSFINKNRFLLKSEYNINFNDKTITKKFVSALDKKRRNKNQTLLYHYLAFGNIKKSKQIIGSILQNKNESILFKVIALMTLITLPIIKLIITFFFYFRYTIYILKNKFIYNRED